LLNLGIPSSENTTNEWVIYPQPAATSTHIIPPSIAVGDQVSLFVYDGTGRLIRKLLENTTITQPFNGIEWDGKNDAGQTISTGVYYLSLNKNGVMLHAELLR
jgi:flagellar hook assembly protein FlgD